MTAPIKPMPVLACGPGDFWISVGRHKKTGRASVMWCDSHGLLWRWLGLIALTLAGCYSPEPTDHGACADAGTASTGRVCVWLCAPPGYAFGTCDAAERFECVRLRRGEYADLVSAPGAPAPEFTSLECGP